MSHEDITKVCNIGQKANSFGENPELVQYIHQSCMGFTDAKGKHPVLGTSEAYNCIMVAAYNPLTHATGLAHVDMGTDFSDISNFLEQLRESCNTKLEIHIRGGDPNWRSGTGERLIEAIAKTPNINIKSADIFSPDTNLHLAIDSRNGNVYTDFDYELSASYNDDPQPYQNKLVHEYPLHLQYDGRNEQVGFALKMRNQQVQSTTEIS